MKYFNNERLETENLRVAIEDYQGIEYKLLASLAALNIIQSAVIFSGLVAGLLVCTRVSLPAPAMHWLRLSCRSTHSCMQHERGWLLQTRTALQY